VSTGDALYSLIHGDSAIAALSLDGISPGFAPPGDGKYITYTQVGEQQPYSLSGGENLVTERWQFNLWASSATALDTMGAALKTLLSGYVGTQGSVDIRGIFFLDARETPDSSPDADANRVYGKQQDYQVTSRT
jgi:hypothetical protein